MLEEGATLERPSHFDDQIDEVRRRIALLYVHINGGSSGQKPIQNAKNYTALN